MYFIRASSEAFAEFVVTLKLTQRIDDSNKGSLWSHPSPKVCMNRIMLGFTLQNQFTPSQWKDTGMERNVEGDRRGKFEDSVDFRSYDPQLVNQKLKLPPNRIG